MLSGSFAAASYHCALQIAWCMMHASIINHHDKKEEEIVPEKSTNETRPKGLYLNINRVNKIPNRKGEKGKREILLNE